MSALRIPGFTHPTAEQCAAWRDAELRRLNKEYGVIERPADFSGWHLAWTEPYKPGVIHGELTRRTSTGFEMRHFYASVDMLRVASELGMIAKSDGYILPL